MPSICAKVRIVGTLRNQTSIKGSLRRELSIAGHVVVPHLLGEVYTGTYVVTPDVDEQVLPTQYKQLERDITVKSIPYFDVSNTSGGRTVYIGSEV